MPRMSIATCTAFGKQNAEQVKPIRKPEAVSREAASGFSYPEENETGVAHRLASPEEMAGPIVFLASDMVSFISGIDLCVDSADRTTKVLKLKKDVTNIPMTNPLVIKMAKKAMDKQNHVK